MSELTPAQGATGLREAYKAGRLVPFLGAGFSKPLWLPDWSQLVEWMAEPLEFDPKLFALHGDARQLAGYLALDRVRYEVFVKRVQAEFNSPDADARRKTSIQHQALAARRFRTIYTTNFDYHIEEALREAGRGVITLSRLADFMKYPAADECQVIKFHGDLSSPETLVLTEQDYFKRFHLDSAPDLRLRLDLLNNSFLFLGYSFSDPNIRYILHRIAEMRSAATAGGGSPAPLRCYWADFRFGLIQPALLHEWGVDVITLDPVDKSRSVADLLNALD